MAVKLQTLTEHLAETEQNAFADDSERYTYWEERRLRAEGAKSSWFADYLDCQRILSNDIPLTTQTDSAGNVDGIEAFTDEMYKTNSIISSMQWKQSLLEKADMSLLLKGIDGLEFGDKAPLEKELNFCFDKFNITRQSITALWDYKGFGFASHYLGWNGKARTAQFKRGIPKYRAVDSRAYLVDPSSTKRNWEDRRYSFERILMDIEDAKVAFPGFDFTETAVNSTYGDSTDMSDMAEIWFVQYKKLKSYPAVETSAQLSEGGQITKREKLAYAPEVQMISEAKRAQNPNDETLDHITVSDEMEVEAEHWFQFYYSKDLAKILTPIEYVGDIDHYAIMHDFRIAGDIYPRSFVYLSRSIVNAECVLFTKAIVDTITNGTPLVQIEEGALTDRSLETINSANPLIETTAEWRDAHRDMPDLKPVQFTFRNTNPTANINLMQIIQNAYQILNGDIPSARGQAEFSGQSGVQTGQLQSAAMILTKTEELAYRDFFKKLGDILLRFIVDFRDYEHTIPGGFENGQPVPEAVNKDDVVIWDWEQYFIIPIVENNPEAIKSIRAAQDAQWAAEGWMHPVDVMERSGEDNADELFNRGLEYKGLKLIFDAVNADPNAKALVMQTLQQYQQQSKTAK